MEVEKMLYGRKIVLIDLSKNKVKIILTPSWLITDYLGGIGFLAKVLYDSIPPCVDPYHKDNIIGIACGPLTGEVVYSGRFVIASKSPLTQGWGESHCGGDFGIYLKSLGYDALLIKGTSKIPCNVYLDREGIRVEQSEEWGLTINETVDSLKIEEKTSILAIGPAGENRVRFATISNNGTSFGGRCGLGAIMGSKQLKAIISKSSQPTANVTNNKSLKKINKHLADLADVKKRTLKLLGTSNLIDLKNILHCLPAKNHTLSFFPYEEEIQEFVSNHKIRDEGCPHCSIRCKKILTMEREEIKMPEYETLCALGSNVMNGNLWSIVELNQLCNDYGLDTISTGRTISFILECAEKKIFNTDEMVLEWGNVQTLKLLVEKIAKREGIGDLLAEGVKIASGKILGSDHYALHVKGMEVPGQDPRTHPSMSLTWAISSRGADHLHALVADDECMIGTDTSLIPELVKDAEDLSILSDSLIMCKFVFIGGILTKAFVATMLQTSTGKPYSVGLLNKICSNITNIRRAFNLREGFSRNDDNLPRRFSEESLDRSTTFDVEELTTLLYEYYFVRGWNEYGSLNTHQLAKIRTHHIAIALDKSTNKEKSKALGQR